MSIDHAINPDQFDTKCYSDSCIYIHQTDYIYIEYLTDVTYYTMLELDLFIIAGCLSTLGSLVSDERKANLSRTFCGIFTFFSRSSKKYKTISEISLGNKHSNNYALGVQSFALSGLEHRPTGLNRSIHVTRDTSQHSTIEV